MSDSVQPQRRQPTRLPRPWDSPGKNTGVGCHFLLQCKKVKSESEVAQSCSTLSDSMDAAYQAPPPLGFSRQEYWSGVPSPSPYTSLSARNQITRARKRGCVKRLFLLLLCSSLRLPLFAAHFSSFYYMRDGLLCGPRAL